MVYFKTNAPLLAGMTACAFIWLALPLKNQAVEPYAYAAAAEGYYNLTQTFAAASDKAILPNISHYHPNHPLPHFLAWILHAATGLSAMKVFKNLNFCGGLLFIFCLFHTLRLFVKSNLAITLTLLFAATSYSFWLSALSGEMQMFSLALTLASLYYLLRYFDARERASAGHLYAAASIYALAGAFHLFSFVLIFPAAVALIASGVSRQQLQRYGLALGIIVLGYAFFYGILLVKILHITSVDQYIETIFIYKNILVREYNGGEWLQLFGKSFARAIVYSETTSGLAAKIGMGALLSFGFWQILKSSMQLPVKILLISWPLLQIGVQIVVRGRPDGLNFWLFLFPVFCLAVAHAWQKIYASDQLKLLGLFLAGLVAVQNLVTGILPNATQKEGEFIFAQKPDFDKKTPVAFVIHQPVFTFAEVWQLGSNFGFIDQSHLLPCCGEKNYLRALGAWLKLRKNFIIAVDADYEAIENLLRTESRRYTISQDSRATLSPNAIPSSIYFETNDRQYTKRLRVYTSQ